MLRALATTALLLIVPMGAAETVLHLHATDHGNVAAGLAYVTDGTTVQTHQNMQLEVLAGERIWFTAESLHEHDGITTFHTGLHGDTTVRVTGDAEIQEPITAKGETDRSSIEVMHDESTVRIQGDGPMVGEWIARDNGGVVARGWFDTDTAIRDLVTLNLDGTHVIEVRPVGAAVQTLDLAPAAPENRLRTIPPEDEALPCGADVRLDPPDVLTGNPVRITAGDLAKKSAVHYRLMQDVDVLNEYMALQWSTVAAGGASAFRVPEAGVYTLHVEPVDGTPCVVPINAEDGSAESATPDWSFEQVGADIRFNADVEGNGHYEYPLWVSVDQGDGPELVWAGKLHSHGGGVAFTIPDASPGEYQVRFDVGAQGADPIVPSVNGWTGKLTVDEPDAEVQSTPAPLGAVALLCLALYLRRR